MAARIQASMALQSSSLFPVLIRHARPHILIFRRFFSNATLPRRRSALAIFNQTPRRFSAQDNFTSSDDLCFEAPLRIIEYPDPRLRAKNKPIITFDAGLQKLADEMFDVMYKTNGIGLAAPQVGMNIQLMVFNPAGEQGEGEEIILANPKVHRASEKCLLFNEGCLSFPGIHGDVLRPASVKIAARNIDGEKFRVSFSGLHARIFQHEFDHLQGVLFFDRMAEDVLASIRLELEALEKKYEDQTRQLSPEKTDNFKQRHQLHGGLARTF